MHLIGEPGVGILIFLLLTLQGGAMLVCTGRFLQFKAEGPMIVRIENCVNTAILILLFPVVAVLLTIGRYQTVDLTHLVVDMPGLVYGLEAGGMAFMVFGTVLIVLGFLALRKIFQPGGLAPRSEDSLVTWGIYSFVRNPLNSGVLFMTLGLAMAVQSISVLFLFAVYLILALQVLSLEEKQLSAAFGQTYRSYCQGVRRLVPFIY